MHSLLSIKEKINYNISIGYLIVSIIHIIIKIYAKEDRNVDIISSFLIFSLEGFTITIIYSFYTYLFVITLQYT